MAGVYKGLTIRIGADTTGLDRALRNARKSVSGVSGEIRKVERALRLDPGNTTLLASQQENYRAKIRATSEELSALRKAEEQIGQGNMSSTQWASLQSDIQIAERSLEEYEAELRRLEVAQEAANSKIGQAGQRLADLDSRLRPVGEKLAGIGDRMTIGVTLPMAAGAGAAIKAATDIDTALTNVKKTVDGTAEDYGRLRDAAVEYSKVNAVPASEILNVEALGAQLGFTLDLFSNGKSQVQEFGEVVSGLDIATNMSAEQAGTELAQFFNIMQENKELASNYGSTIVALGNSFATTEGDVSAMAMRIAGAGKSIGLSSADVLGLAASLTSLGIEAEAGGTAVSTVMSQIDKDVATGSENLATWAHAAHMGVDEFVEAWGTDAVSALDAVLRGMEADVDAGGNLSLMLDELGISSIRQTDMMKRLANSGDLMREAVDTANEAWRDNTALSDEVANRNDSLAAKFEMLRNRLVAVAAEVGEPLADALFELVDAAEPLFQAIENGARTFAEMSDGEQRAVVQTVALIAAIGPALSLFGRVTRAVGVLGRALTAASRLVGAGKVALRGMGDSMRYTSQQAALMQREAAASGKTMSSLGANARVAGNALKASAAASKVASVAMKALSTAGVMLAVTAVVELISAIGSYIERQEQARQATAGLLDAVGTLGSGGDGAADALGRVAGAVDGYKASVDDCIEKQAELARSIAEDFAETNREAGALDWYAAKIAELAGACEGSPEKLADLKVALDGYNQIAGTTYSVTDEATGALDASTEAILRNADAWEANAYKQAAAEKLTELAKQQIDNELALEAAEERRSAATERLAGEMETLGYNTQASINESIEADKEWRRASDTCEAGAKAIDQLNSKSAEYQRQIDSLTGASLKPWIEANEEVSAKLGEIGVSVGDAASRMSALGYTTETMAALTADQFAAMAGSAGMSIGDMVAACEQLGIDLPPTIQAAIAQADAVCGEGGAGLVREFVAGMTANEFQAAQEAAKVSGMSADEFFSRIAEYGIAGEGSVMEFAHAVRAGTPAAQAAAEAMGASASSAAASKADGAPAGARLSGTAASAVSTTAMNVRSMLMTEAAIRAAKSGDPASIGYWLSQGAANGINVNAMVGRATAMAAAAMSSMKAALGIRSPSREARRLGRFFAEGAALGIEDATGEVERAAGGMARAALRSAEMSAPSWEGRGAGAALLSASGAIPGAVDNSVHVAIDGATVNSIPEIKAATKEYLETLSRYAEMNHG